MLGSIVIRQPMSANRLRALTTNFLLVMALAAIHAMTLGANCHL